MKKIYCKDCFYFDPDDDVDLRDPRRVNKTTVGYCRRFPPKNVGTNRGQLKVEIDIWCGEAQPKPDSEQS